MSVTSTSQVTLHIVDLWQYYVCYIRSGLMRCTLFMMLYLCHVCQLVRFICGLWSHLGTLMSLLTAEPRSVAGLLFPSQYLCGTILPTLSLFDGVGLPGFKRRDNAFVLAIAARSLFVFYCFFIFLISLCRLVLWGWGLRTDRVSIALF